jgi:hypothetical protein
VDVSGQELVVEVKWLILNLPDRGNAVLATDVLVLLFDVLEFFIDFWRN